MVEDINQQIRISSTIIFLNSKLEAQDWCFLEYCLETKVTLTLVMTLVGVRDIIPLIWRLVRGRYLPVLWMEERSTLGMLQPCWLSGRDWRRRCPPQSRNKNWFGQFLFRYQYLRATFCFQFQYLRDTFCSGNQVFKAIFCSGNQLFWLWEFLFVFWMAVKFWQIFKSIFGRTHVLSISYYPLWFGAMARECKCQLLVKFQVSEKPLYVNSDLISNESLLSFMLLYCEYMERPPFTKLWK